VDILWSRWLQVLRGIEFGEFLEKQRLPAQPVGARLSASPSTAD